MGRGMLDRKYTVLGKRESEVSEWRYVICAKEQADL